MKDFLSALRRFVPPYKKYVIWSVLANILSALLNLLSFALIVPILSILFRVQSAATSYIPMDDLEWWKMGELVNTLKNNFEYSINQMIEVQGGSFTLIMLGIYLVLMTGLKVSAMYLGFYSMIPLRTGVVRDIRNQINDKIIALPLSFFSEERKGDILARISGDVNEIEASVLSSLDLILKNPILIVVYLSIMLVLSWELTLFVFILLPIAGWIMGKVGKNLKRKSFEAQSQWGGLMSQIEETLSGLRIIKAFNAEKKIGQRFRSSNEEYRRTSMRVFRRQQLAHPMSEFLGTATIAIVLWYGGSLILQDNSSIDAATFIYYLTIFYSLINPAKELSKASYTIEKGLASMERIDKILLAESDIVDPINPLPIPFEHEICYTDVWFRYADEWVLKGINLKIEKGMTVALVGQSGSGKSTLVDLLPRFYNIDKGSICIDGVAIDKATSKELRQLMGNVNQEAILFNDTVFNNIAFGSEDASIEEVERAARIANAHEFIEQMPEGYQTNIGDRGSKLSGGQRQRLSIARAVLKNPPILILDEATSALDTESERLVQEALEQLMQHRTTLVIAHRLSTIRKADLICVIHEGEIVEQGQHDELLAREGYYSRLCNMQSFSED